MAISIYVPPKKYLALGALVVVALVAAREYAPALIESAYNGSSLRILNALIKRQDEYPLAHYQAKFLLTFNVTVFVSLFGAYFFYLYLFLVKNNKPSNALAVVERYWVLCGAALLLYLAAYLFTIWPGGTFVSIMTHDLFIFLDGAYRVSQGQIPHLDFHTPIGILAYLLPYLGLAIRGQIPGTMEMANFIVAAWILVVSIHILASRYRILPAIITLCFFLLIIVAPINLGTDEVAHAMFYNRYGWVCLSLLYLFYLEPQQKSRTQGVLDIMSMASLVGFLFYLKLTYFVFGLAFVILMTLVSRPKRRLAGYSLLLFLAIVVCVEFSIKGLHSHYLKDVVMAVKSSGVVRENRNTLWNVINELIFAAIGIFFIYKVRPLRLYDYCYMALVVVSSVIIINQNYQTTGLVSFVALLLWGHEVSSRTNLQTEFRSGSGLKTIHISSVFFVLLILFIGLPIVKRIKALSEVNQVLVYKPTEYSTNIMANFFVGDRGSSLPVLANEKDPVKLFNGVAFVKRAQYLTQGEYIETIEQGLPLIRSLNPSGDSVMVFDMANPFSLLLKAMPPVGDYSFYHHKRDINTATHVPAEELFKTVTYVMIPKIPMTPGNTKFLQETYGEYLQNNFEKKVENLTWEIYKKK